MVQYTIRMSVPQHSFSRNQFIFRTEHFPIFRTVIGTIHQYDASRWMPAWRFYSGFQLTGWSTAHIWWMTSWCVAAATAGSNWPADQLHTSGEWQHGASRRLQLVPPTDQLINGTHLVNDSMARRGGYIWFQLAGWSLAHILWMTAWRVAEATAGSNWQADQLHTSGESGALRRLQLVPIYRLINCTYLVNNSMARRGSYSWFQFPGWSTAHIWWMTAYLWLTNPHLRNVGGTIQQYDALRKYMVQYTIRMPVPQHSFFSKSVHFQNRTFPHFQNSHWCDTTVWCIKVVYGTILHKNVGTST